MSAAQSRIWVSLLKLGKFISVCMSKNVSMSQSRLSVNWEVKRPQIDCKSSLISYVDFQLVSWQSFEHLGFIMLQKAFDLNVCMSSCVISWLAIVLSATDLLSVSICKPISYFWIASLFLSLQKKDTRLKEQNYWRVWLIWTYRSMQLCVNWFYFRGSFFTFLTLNNSN